MFDLYELLKKIQIHPEQEQKLPTEETKQYVRMKILEQQIQQVKVEIIEENHRLFNSFTAEELHAIESFLKETQALFNIPKYLTVKEVSMLIKLSPQIIRRHCSNGKIKGYQASRENGTWLVESEQFLSHPDWIEFLQQRSERFARSKKVAELALEMWDSEDETEE